MGGGLSVTGYRARDYHGVRQFSGCWCPFSQESLHLLSEVSALEVWLNSWRLDVPSSEVRRLGERRGERTGWAKSVALLWKCNFEVPIGYDMEIPSR